MKFSIITCTWNSEPYLARSIASVLEQDTPVADYVFVDGGSTDGTLDRIRAINRPITLLENVRGGISRAMNAGLEAATGDVIAHLHSDDYYVDSRVLSDVSEAMHRTGALWAIGRIVVDREGRLVSEMTNMPPYSFGRLAAGSFFVPHPATFVRREAMMNLTGFDETLRYAMDWDMWLRLGQLGDPVIINRPLAAFREHAGSVSSANQLAARREERTVRARYWHKAPLAFALYLGRYWRRTRRLAQAVAIS